MTLKTYVRCMRTYAEDGYDCDGVCLNDADGDGVCDEFEVAGCQDAEACNHDADATTLLAAEDYDWRRRLRPMTATALNVDQ